MGTNIVTNMGTNIVTNIVTNMGTNTKTVLVHQLPIKPAKAVRPTFHLL